MLPFQRVIIIRIVNELFSSPFLVVLSSTSCVHSHLALALGELSAGVVGMLYLGVPIPHPIPTCLLSPSEVLDLLASSWGDQRDPGESSLG